MMEFTRSATNDIRMKVTPHMLRHGFATRLLQNGTEARKIQLLLERSSIQTAVMHKHISAEPLAKITSPIDLRL